MLEKYRLEVGTESSPLVTGGASLGRECGVGRAVSPRSSQCRQRPAGGGQEHRAHFPVSAGAARLMIPTASPVLRSELVSVPPCMPGLKGRTAIHVGVPDSAVSKSLPASAGDRTWGQSLGRDDPQEKERATHPSILAWETLWAEDLQSTGSQRSRV